MQGLIWLKCQSFLDVYFGNPLAILKNKLLPVRKQNCFFLSKSYNYMWKHRIGDVKNMHLHGSVNQFLELLQAVSWGNASLPCPEYTK